MTVTTTELTNELITLVKAAPSIGANGYSVFNLEELMVGATSFPIAGVTYEGSGMKENSAQGQPKVKSGVFLTAYFTIIVGINYQYGSTTDTKPLATDLLDELKGIVLGYRGVNKRPWRYSGETPMNTDMEGVIFYGQQWETDFPIIGNTAN